MSATARSRLRMLTATQDFDGIIETVESVRDERDRMIRLWNRLEAAVSHHKKAHDRGDAFAEDADVALWNARDRILHDYAEGND